MKINIRLVRASQFLKQFHLIVKYKSGKEHIIIDTLNKLASTNNVGHNLEYSELYTLFVYHKTLV